jgi:hypothetical protein
MQHGIQGFCSTLPGEGKVSDVQMKKDKEE